MRLRTYLDDTGTSSGLVPSGTWRRLNVPETNIHFTEPATEGNPEHGDFFAVSGLSLTPTSAGVTSVRLEVRTSSQSLNDYFMTATTGTPTRSGACFASCTSETAGSDYYRAFNLTLDFEVTGSATSEFTDLVRVAADGDAGAGQIVQYIIGTDCSTSFAGIFEQRELTEEEREEARLRREEMRRLREQEEQTRRARQLTAEGRALKLLMTLLSPGQWESLLENGHFDVAAPNNKVYRLFYALHGNVLRMSADMEPEEAYCGHMGGSLPVADTLVSQRLLLSHSPEKYEKSANRVRREHMGWCRPRDDYREFLPLALASAV